MAVSEDLTKLSDELRRLSARAEDAEKRVAAAREKTKADIEADRDAALAPRVSNRPSSCARRPTRVATGSRRGGPTSSEAQDEGFPRFAPTSSPAKGSTTCTRPSTTQTGPRKKRGSRSTSPIRL